MRWNANSMLDPPSGDGSYVVGYWRFGLKDPFRAMLADAIDRRPLSA